MSTARPGATRRALLIMLAALAALLVIGLGASADHQVVLRTPAPDSREFLPPGLKTGYSEEQWDHEQNQEKREDLPQESGSVALIVALIAVVALSALLLLAWILRRAAALRPERRQRAEAVDAPEMFSVDEAEAALTTARDLLQSAPDAQGAVVDAWLALERAVAASGVRRRPSWTTREFVLTVLETVDLDVSPLERFADLYRRALFDAHPITEEDRAEAARLLETVTADLNDRRAGARA